MKISVISVLYNQKLAAGNTWNTLTGPALSGTAKAEALSGIGESCVSGEGPEKACSETSGQTCSEVSGQTGGETSGKDHASRDIQVILADNSDNPHIREENRRAAEACGAVYLDMQGNRGLPAAYNRAIEVVTGNTINRIKTGSGKYAEENKSERDAEETESGRDAKETGSAEKKDSWDEWIVITDQDTMFPENYLQIVEKTAGQTACDVLVPVVKAGQKLLSPCRRKGSHFVPVETETLTDEVLQEAFFINTGLAFRRALLEDPEIRYDEQLFLDFVDFDLINRLRARAPKKVRFGQLSDVVLQQQFSGTERRTAEQDLERFRHFAHDGRLFYERWYGKGAAEGAIRRRALRLAAKHRDIRFLKK